MSSPPLASSARRRAALVTAAAALLCAIGVESAAAQGAREDKALRRPASASSVEDQRGGTCAFRICTPDKANDGRDDTRWGSAFADNQFWQVDLGAARLVNTVRADWQTAYPAVYRVSTSLDGVNFELVGEGSLPANLPRERNHVVVETTFAARQARYVRLTGVRRATQWGFSLWTVNVFGPPDVQSAAPVQAPPAPAAPPAEPAAEPAASSGAPATGPVVPGASGSAPALRPIAASTRVRLAGKVAGAKTSVRLLAIRAPRKATVQVLCSGRGCPDAVPTRRGSGRIRELRRTLRAGAVLEIFITQPRTYGKYTRFRFRRGAPPRRVDRCVTQGSTPIACPAGT